MNPAGVPSGLFRAGPRGLRRGCRGFTLAELIVASIILTLIVGTTTVCVAQSMRSRDSAQAAGEAFSRAQLAAERIALDAAQALRDTDLLSTRVAIVRGGPAGKTSQGLLLLAHQARSARAGTDASEGDEYEVQFRLEPATVSSGNTPGTRYTLWRRCDPALDDVPDGGGVATPLVDSLTNLTFEVYNGTEWLADWDSDNDGYPHAIRIVATATDDQGRRTATARRVVALDRTPKPVSEETEEEEDTGGTTTGGGST